MPKWIKYFDEDCLVMLPKDLEIAKPIIEKARKLWSKSYKDEGSAVLDSGISVLFLPKHCRKPVEKIIISPMGLGDGSGTIDIPLNYLNRCGIPAFWTPGRID
jgi:hypothetical protein